MQLITYFEKSDAKCCSYVLIVIEKNIDTKQVYRNPDS